MTEPTLDNRDSSERPIKLARSQMRSFMIRMLKEQGGMCPLCGKPIDITIKGEGVTDHNHDNGRVRGILHRSCNAAEGRVSNAAARWGAKSSAYEDIIPFLEALVTYLKRPPTRYIYALHKTDDEKRDDRNRKAREARAAAKAKLALRSRKEPT